MDDLHVIAHFKIHEGQLERFMELADTCLGIVKEQDQGTRQYDWCFDADRTECIVLERYRDSDAVLEHIAHVGEALGPLTEIADLKLTVCGAPSAALLEASAGMDVKVYGHYRGI